MTADSPGLHCDVVVVGAGPTGMTAAALLATAGLDVVVLERNPGTSAEPKAVSLDDEALRTYQRAGIVQDVMPIITPGTGTRYYDAAGRPVFQARAAVPYIHGYPFKNPFAQPDLERALQTALKRNPSIRLQFDCAVESFSQDADSVTVTASAGGGETTVTARYLLGADGGRSVVRSSLGIEMTGRSHSEVWLVTDTMNDPHIERYGMHHGDPQRPHVLVPGPNGRCRYEFLLHPGEGEPGEAPPFALIKKLVAPYRDITEGDVERAVNYRFHSVNADSYRQGRAFLLGDAAHMMAPFAGQGLNSGLRDAANLSWKLAQVIQQGAPDSILDSYEAERSPHARATIQLSAKLGSIVMTTSRRVAEHRDRLVHEAMTTPRGREYFEEMQYRPPSSYQEGLLWRFDSDTVGAMIGQPRVFDPTTHQTLLLDEAVGYGWVLFGVHVGLDDWAAAAGIGTTLSAPAFHVPLDDTTMRGLSGPRLLLDLDDGLHREFEPHRGRFVLLRPDRFIAASWLPRDTPSMADAADWLAGRGGAATRI